MFDVERATARRPLFAVTLALLEEQGLLVRRPRRVYGA